MTNQEAIKYLQQIYPNGGHCLLDEQRIEAIGMAVKVLQEEPVSKLWHDSNKEQPKAESDVAIWDGERGEILTRCVKVNPNKKWAYMEDLLNKKEEPVSEDLEEAAKRYALNNTPYEDCTDEMSDAFKAGARWQEEKDNEEKVLIYKHGFDDCKEQFEKNRLAACDRQTAEDAERESDFVMSVIEKEHRQPTFDDAIKYGYHQAEKDLELTWEDMSKIRQIMFDYNRQLRPEIVENKASLPKDEEYCREVLNRFKKGKG